MLKKDDLKRMERNQSVAVLSHLEGGKICVLNLMHKIPAATFSFCFLIGLFLAIIVFPSASFSYQEVNQHSTDLMADGTVSDPLDLIEQAFVDQFDDKNAAVNGWRQGGGNVLKRYFKSIYVKESIEELSERMSVILNVTRSKYPDADPYILSFMALNSFYSPSVWGSSNGTTILTGVEKNDATGFVEHTTNVMGVPFLSASAVSDKPLSHELIQNKNLLVIRIVSIAYMQTSQSIEKLVQEHDGPIVLDLRGGTGGFLSEIRKILSIFNAGGTELFRTQSASSVTPQRYHSSRHPNFVVKNPLMVVFDKDTYIGSLILVASLQDSKRAFVAGPQRKDVAGRITTVIPLSSDFCPHAEEKCSLQIPTGEFIRTSGLPLSDGIQPDISLDWSDPAALNRAVSVWLNDSIN